MRQVPCMEETIRSVALEVASLIDAAATLVVAAASVEVIVRSALAFFTTGWAANLQPIRWRLGNWIGLALELLIGSDVVRTAVSPSWTDVGQLGAIVVLRVVINYTLMYDMKEGVPPSPAP
jgi:uncharacterized membrane protein